MNLEQELSRLLVRRQPRAGFADRVLARIEESESSAVRPAPRSSRAWVAIRRAAAAVVLVAVLGGVAVHEIGERRRRAEGERARQQVLVALHIASAKVRVAQQEIRSIGN
jgi:hypothetical protein